jgi:cathepsin X
VLNQQSPNVCGSCWAEAATGALSDRFTLATQGVLRAQLAPQVLLNFDARISGGSCNGGSDLKAYEFMHRYGIVDDSCQPFVGLNWLHGFSVAGMVDPEKVREHQCFECDWNGVCDFRSEHVELYFAEEFGQVTGEQEMMNEIATRGPIACSLNSDAVSFDQYHGGIITCPRDSPLTEHVECKSPWTDHVIVIAGYGYDEETGLKFWVGRNSYGSSWGEGAGGGWFRLERGVNALNIEAYPCSWAVPSAQNVARAMKEYTLSIATN